MTESNVALFQGMMMMMMMMVMMMMLRKVKCVHEAACSNLPMFGFINRVDKVIRPT